MDNNYNNGQQGGNQNLPEPTEEITGYIDGPDPNAPQGGYPNGSAPYGQQQGYQNGPNPNYYGPQNPYQQQGYQNGPAPNYYGPQNPYQQNIQNPYQAPPEGSVGMAVASMVLGIVGFLISCCFYPVTIVTGIVLSIISLAFAVLVIILAASAGTTSLWEVIEDMALFIK